MSTDPHVHPSASGQDPAALLAAALEALAGAARPHGEDDCRNDDCRNDDDREGAIEESDVTLDMLPAEAVPHITLEALPDEAVALLLARPALRLLVGDIGTACAAAEETSAAECALSAEVRAAAMSAFDAPAATAEATSDGIREFDFDDVDARLLEDVAAAQAAADETRSPADLSPAVLSPAVLSPAVRAAALAAFDGDEAVPTAAATLRLHGRRGRVRNEPLRARTLQPLLSTRAWVSAAALLLLLIGGGLFLAGSSDEAEAGLQLSSLARVDRGSSMRLSQVQPRYFAEMGRLFTPAEDELLAFGLSRDARVIVGSGDAVRVTDERVPGAPAEGALLRLESGEVLLVTDRRPLALLVDGVGLLVLLDGAAHVAIDAAGGPAVALPPGSEARFHSRDGSSITLAGPATGLLSEAGPGTFGEDARSLFDELKFFGGPLPRPIRESTVSARICKVQHGLVRRGRQDLQILAAEADMPASAAIAWQPKPWLADAHALRVKLRAPAGTTVSVAGLSVADSGVATATIPASEDADGSAAAEPGIAVVTLPMAAGWYGRLRGGPLVVEVSVPAVLVPAVSAPAVSAPAVSAPAVSAPAVSAPAVSVAAPETSRTTRKPARAWFDGFTLVLGSASTDSIAAPERRGDD